MIRNINDPEHPLTLEQLNVTQLEHIQVDTTKQIVTVKFTPTIPHCSMVGLLAFIRLFTGNAYWTIHPSEITTKFTQQVQNRCVC